MSANFLDVTQGSSLQYINFMIHRMLIQTIYLNIFFNFPTCPISTECWGLISMHKSEFV